MTKYHKQQKEIVLTRDGFVCCKCGKPTYEAAHMIPQRGYLIKKYGEVIIHHASNMRASCSKHNNDFQLSPWEWEKKAEEIKSEIGGENERFI